MKSMPFFSVQRVILLLITVVITSPTALRSQGSLLDSLILDYLFESGNATTAIDSSAAGFHGQILGEAVRVEGYRGMGMEFNGLDAHVLVGDTQPELDLRGFTLMTWLSPHSRGSDDKRMEIIEKTNQYWMNIRKETGLMRSGCFFVPRDDNKDERWYYMDSDRPVPLDAWTHVAYTYDDTLMTSYLNGRPVNSYRVDLDVRETDYDCSVGSRQPRMEGGDVNPAAWFHGKMDEFRIFRRCLGQEEILEMMSLNNPVALPPAAPSQLSADASEPGRVVLRWIDASENEEEFWIFVSENDMDWEYAGWAMKDSVNYAYTEGEGGSDLSFRICAAGLAGRSEYSESIQVTVPQEDEPKPESAYSFESNLADAFGSRHGVEADQVAYGEGIVGQAIQFNGTDAYAAIPYNLVDDFTISLWIRTATAGQTHSAEDWFRGSGIVDANVGGYCGEFGLSLFGENASFGTGGFNSHKTITGKKRLNDDEWHHLACVFHSGVGQMELYVDGIADIISLGGKTAPKNAAGTLILGSTHQDFNYYTGMIDELKLYTRGLSPGQIADIIASDTAGSVIEQVEIPAVLSLRIFPNPARDFLYISSAEALEVEIISTGGQVLFSGRVEEGQGIPLRDLEPGLYLLRYLDREGRSGIDRFIKQ